MMAYEPVIDKGQRTKLDPSDGVTRCEQVSSLLSRRGNSRETTKNDADDD